MVKDITNPPDYVESHEGLLQYISYTIFGVAWALSTVLFVFNIEIIPLPWYTLNLGVEFQQILIMLFLIVLTYAGSELLEGISGLREVF